MLAHTFQTCIGPLTLTEEDGRIVRLAFGDEGGRGAPTDTIKRAESQIAEYLNGERTSFDIPVQLPEDGFARDVLETMIRIPYGSTMTYGELAAGSGHPGAARAVGTVCRKNPLPIIIPCHRVVPSSGGYGRYSGPEGLKDHLLRMESEKVPDAGR